MAKLQLQSINEVTKHLGKDNLLPIYFLCGEDTYSIDLAVEAIDRAVSPFIESDFDREIFGGEKSLELTQVLDLALAFPFGGGKKLITIKNFDKINDKKALSAYVKNPPEFTVLIITNLSKLADVSKEPFSFLLAKNFIFEAKPLTGYELVNWFLRTAKKQGLEIPEENAKAVIEIVGEEKTLLEIQIQKYSTYAQGKNQLSIEELIKLSSPTKEYSIFDFISTLGVGNKSRALEIGSNLIDSGADMVYIINMVAKFIMTVAQIIDLTRQKTNDNDGARLAGVSYYYYLNCKKASFFMMDERLHNASRALLNADIATKSTAMNPKTVLQILISEMLGQVVQSPFN
jgi:DNA polymerase III subunit delta